MKSFGKIYRETAEGLLKDKLHDSNSIFFVKYTGVEAAVLGQLRQDLKDTGARLFVSRNSLAKRVASDMYNQQLLEFIDGPTGFVIIDKDPVTVSKILKAFIKENEAFNIRGGILQNRLLTKKDIESLAILPSREILLSMIARGIKAPISSFVLLLNQMLVRLVIVMKAISDKKK